MFLAMFMKFLAVSLNNEVRTGYRTVHTVPTQRPLPNPFSSSSTLQAFDIFFCV